MKLWKLPICAIWPRYFQMSGKDVIFLINWIFTEAFLSSRTCGQTESSRGVPLDGPLKETSRPCALMGPNGFGKGLENVPRMRGIWPASTSVSCPSCASWCLLFRKCLWWCQCLSEEMLFYLNTMYNCLCFFLIADSTTARAKKGIWTAPSRFGFCCCGWGATPAIWWAPSWQTSFHFR